MKIIDFGKKGNLVRFYLGADDDEDYTGNGWDNFSRYNSVGRVYDEHIIGHHDMVFPFEFVVLEPKDPERGRASRWCKNDMKARKVPCIIAVPNHDYLYEDEFDRYVGDKQTIKFYFGDTMEPTHSLTVFERGKQNE